jgi:hypothetical protein
MRNGQPDCKFPDYVNFEYGPIGTVASTKENPNTAQYFNFWISSGVDSVELGNIVAAVTDDGHITFGTVVELRSVMDIENFLSDFISHDFGDPQVNPPSDLAEIMIAKINVIKSSHERIRPIGRGVVYYATPEGVGWALGMADYAEEGRGVPIGVMENGDGHLVPIFLDDEFLIGPEGSHMNMSGISGLATKTSLVEFLLKSILDKMIKTHKRKVAAVFFNVKGKDLLYLDKPNPQYEEDDPYTQKCRQMYDVLGIELAPFENVRVFAPYDSKFEGHTKSFRRDGKVEHFIWELTEIVDEIPTLFDEENWDESVDAVYVDVRDQIERQPITSYDQLIEWLNEERRVVSQAHITHWRGHEKDTFYKCTKNLDSLAGLYDGLVCTGGVDPVDIPLGDLYNGSIFVVDLHSLNDRGQDGVQQDPDPRLPHAARQERRARLRQRGVLHRRAQQVRPVGPHRARTDQAEPDRGLRPRPFNRRVAVRRRAVHEPDRPPGGGQLIDDHLRPYRSRRADDRQLQLAGRRHAQPPDDRAPRNIPAQARQVRPAGVVQVPVPDLRPGRPVRGRGTGPREGARKRVCLPPGPVSLDFKLVETRRAQPKLRPFHCGAGVGGECPAPSSFT